jgi:drug/metabolite transporter (DMT)-like permease
MRVLTSRMKGIFLVLLGAGLWGVSGTVVQVLFHSYQFTPEWLVVIRLWMSSLILLAFCYIKDRKALWEIWKVREDRWRLLWFGIFGMLGVQYTFFATIAAGNAATATLLQYLGPAFVTIYVAFEQKRLPTIRQWAAILLALLGTFFLVSKGDPGKITISQGVLFWGLGSALTAAFYTIQPVKLLKKWGAPLVVGWGMLIGGIGFSFLQPPWQMEGEITGFTILLIVFVIVFGTVIAFYSFLESLQYLSPEESSVLACAEPLSSAIISVTLLHVPFGVTDWIGAACIISTIFLLSVKTESIEEKKLSRSMS